MDNLHVDPRKSANENVKIIVRWNADGQVRGDATGTDGDVPDDGFRAEVATECWKAREGITLYTSLIGLRVSGGEPVNVAESGDVTSCPFARPAVPAIPAPDDEPTQPDAPPETDDSIDWE
jgi:hypothetical protein